MNADQLRRLLYQGLWPDALVRELDSRVVFRALYGVFVDRSRPDRAFADQQAAGRRLMELLPEPDAPLADLIRQSLGTWNPSVEELPHYLARKFGLPAVLRTVEQISRTPDLSNDEGRLLDTYRYWLGGTES
jgi:hypothetical protein